jgi:hypothetical protein
MSKNITSKQVREKFNITVDFSNVLNSGEALTSGSLVLAYLTSTDTEVSSAIVESSSFNTSNVVVTVHSGSDNSGYKLSFIATTNSGSVFEEDVFINVKDN